METKLNAKHIESLNHFGLSWVNIAEPTDFCSICPSLYLKYWLLIQQIRFEAENENFIHIYTQSCCVQCRPEKADGALYIYKPVTGHNAHAKFIRS